MLQQALILTLALAIAAPATAQTLRGVSLGEPIPDDAPEALGTMIEPPFALTRWDFDDGLAMSATTDAETGEVYYVEMWTLDRARITSAPVPGVSYGQTTLADLAALFGSEGVWFGGRERFTVMGAITAYFTSYEIEGTDAVVTFTTVQPTPLAAPETMADSVLHSISLSLGTYLDQIWSGNRGRSEGYAPIADPFTE